MHNGENISPTSPGTTVPGDFPPTVEPEFSDGSNGEDDEMHGLDIPESQKGRQVDLLSASIPVTPTVMENSQGLLACMPEIPEPSRASSPGQALANQVPELTDPRASKPRLDEHTLSTAAIQSRAQRIFRLRANGEKKVSEEIWNDWHAKGQRKKTLEMIFKRCGYDPEPLIAIGN